MAVKKKAVKRPGASRARTQKSSAIELPRLGAVWKAQGGHFVGIVAGENGDPDYAVVLPTQSSASLKGAYGVREHIKGADSDNDGRANTKAMAAAGSVVAKQALSLRIGGHDDFYIPAPNEARLIDMNARALVKTGYHWTSKQVRAFGDFAWAQYFGYGNQSTPARTTSCRSESSAEFHSTI